MKHYLTLVLTVLIIGLTVFADADTIFMEPCDDMYTDVEHPTTPPTSDQLWVAEFSGAGHFERIMIQFNLSELQNATIEDATLHLYRFFSCPMSGTTATYFYAITQEWNEETWDPHTHIQYNPYIWASFTFSGPGGNYGMWFEVNITNLVQEWVNSQIENHGFVIRAISGYKWSKFYSKEYTNSNLHPYLEVDYTQEAIDDNDIPVPAINIENYPNPFNTETTISFNLPKNGNVKLTIYNSKGQIVKTLVDNYLNIGEHKIEFDASNLISGIYFYKIQIYDFSKIKKTILLK
ncbi:MAG: DNRLRE domain-containing protein [Candidatus Cloacimonadota bacterium]|nr:DNRLRE domain-containing protein [Candidatus Cloacimonadota bacterium]